ncbi:TPA: 4Fe-4S binding protein [Candidatus Galligastranaerophilus intestinavium]|uniref:4Fe-4S binding protein n=1 Tax=Candidatus Galligastranaerophilus intestinavium TaxID=2840836 RepID=A0A9D1JXK5_9BACT|nr:4Fe-4S binding protein [Candidatus Galligastranaerophilus intestinavium]
MITKADDDFGAVHIDYSKGYCEKNCNKCSQVCPCGAIKRLSLEEKQRTRIAMAAIKEDKCVKCGACVRACPYGAIKWTAQGIIIDSSKCIGCAKCKVSCKFDAIEIFAIKKQSLI